VGVGTRGEGTDVEDVAVYNWGVEAWRGGGWVRAVFGRGTFACVG
jgi:hypothetical protein